MFKRYLIKLWNSAFGMVTKYGIWTHAISFDDKKVSMIEPHQLTKNICTYVYQPFSIANNNLNELQWNNSSGSNMFIGLNLRISDSFGWLQAICYEIAWNEITISHTHTHIRCVFHIPYKSKFRSANEYTYTHTHTPHPGSIWKMVLNSKQLLKQLADIYIIYTLDCRKSNIAK